MGTHAHLAITHTAGEHMCAEVPMDGGELVSLMCDWVETELPEFGDLQDPTEWGELAEIYDAIGTGDRQWSHAPGEHTEGESRCNGHEDQEQEPEYWVWVDFKERWIDGDAWTMWSAFSDDKAKLRRKGWRVTSGQRSCWETESDPMPVDSAAN